MATKKTPAHTDIQEVAIPKFKSEAEEAAWWDAHPEVATAIMSAAMRAGTARRGPLKTVTMRLPEADLKVARRLARNKGLPYQTYIKMLLHQALQKEGEAS
jgi:predicted DNA binding CopG/RHH family protein